MEFLSPALTWIPRAFLFLRERLTIAGGRGITFRVREHERPASAKFKCKIRVEIANKREAPVRLAGPYFVFNKRSLLKPDPQWSGEYKTGRFPLYFFTPKAGQHEWLDVYLRPTETTDTWIGIDPQHPDDHIKQASGVGRIGRLYFQMTEWNDSGRSKTRRVYMKV
jgi:hypothetical protein